MEGIHALVRWQTLHSCVVGKCLASLPVAVLPLWQVEQPTVMPVCVNDEGIHAFVLWQVLHSCVVTKCLVGFPVAVLPL